MKLCNYNMYYVQNMQNKSCSISSRIIQIFQIVNISDNQSTQEKNMQMHRRLKS